MGNQNVQGEVTWNTHQVSREMVHTEQQRIL